VNKQLIQAASEIKTPLAFLALVIIVTEGIFLYLASKATGGDFTILVVAAAFLPFCSLSVFYFLYRNALPKSQLGGSFQPIKDSVTQQPSGKTYDLFVSAPMASFETESEFKSSRDAIFDVVKGIKRSCSFDDVFYAGTEIESFKEFDSADLSVIEDYDATYHSKYFLLFYPERLATSALIELGWAMAFKKPIIIFYKDHEDLPFLMKHLEGSYTNIRLYKYKTSANVRDKFQTNGVRLFTALETPA
jgi:hypothetical protein